MEGEEPEFPSGFALENPDEALKRPTADGDDRDKIIRAKLAESVLANLSGKGPEKRSMTVSDDALKTHIQQQLSQLFPNGFQTPNHPPYSCMIQRAIKELNERRGSREVEILEFLKREYKSLPVGHESFLSHHMKKLCSTKEIGLLKDGRYVLPDANGNFGDAKDGNSDVGDARRRKGKRGRGRGKKHKKEVNDPTKDKGKWIVEEILRPEEETILSEEEEIEERKELLEEPCNMELDKQQFEIQVFEEENHEEIQVNKTEQLGKRGRGRGEKHKKQDNDWTKDKGKGIAEEILSLEAETILSEEEIEEGMELLEEPYNMELDKHHFEIQVFEDENREETQVNKTKQLVESLTTVTKYQLESCQKIGEAMMATEDQERDVQEMPFNKQNEDLATAALRSVMNHMDRDDSLLTSKGLFTKPSEETKNFQERLSQISVSSKQMEETKRESYRSRFEQQRKKPLKYYHRRKTKCAAGEKDSDSQVIEKQTQSQEVEDSTTGEQSKAEEQQIEVAKEISGLPDKCEDSGCVNLSVPRRQSFLRVVEQKKQERSEKKEKEKRSPNEEREYNVVLGLSVGQSSGVSGENLLYKSHVKEVPASPKSHPGQKPLNVSSRGRLLRPRLLYSGASSSPEQNEQRPCKPRGRGRPRKVDHEGGLHIK